MARATQLLGGLTPLRPIQPFGITKRQKKGRAPRPKYSVDIKAERRKRPRITLEELTERGEAVLREKAPELPRMDKRGLFTKVFDVLDIPRNIIANAIAAAAGVPRGEARRGTFLKKVWMSDVLKHAGMKKGPLRAILGFVSDVLIDPLVYFGLGARTGMQVARHVPRVVGPAARALKAATATGRIGGEVSKVLGRGTAQALQKSYAAIRAGRGAKIAAQQMKRAIGKRLAGAATRGRPEALRYFLRHGEKGRTLFRLPFAAKGVGYLPIGAKARRYQAVLSALDDPGRRAIRKLAGLRGTEAAKVAAEALLSRQIKGKRAAEAAIKAERQAQIVAARAKGGPPEALGRAEKVIRKAMQARGRREVEPLRRRLAREVSAVRQAVRAARQRAAAQMRAGPLGYVKAAKRGQQSSELLTKAANTIARQFGLPQHVVRALPRTHPMLAGKHGAFVGSGGKGAAWIFLADDLGPKRAAKTLEHELVHNWSQLGGHGAAFGRGGIWKGVADAIESVTGIRLAGYAKEPLRAVRGPGFRAQARAAMEKAARKARRALMKPAAAELKLRGAAREAARQAKVAFRGAPEAPALMRELSRVQRGRAIIPGQEGGLWAKIRGLKEAVVGRAPSPMQQQFVGATQRATVLRNIMKARAVAEYTSDVEKIVPELAKAGMGRPEVIRRMLVHLAEAAPRRGMLGKFTEKDPLLHLFKAMQRRGLTRHPKVRSLMDKYHNAMEKVWAVEQAAGIPSGKIPAYVRLPLTPEARQRRLTQIGERRFLGPRQTMEVSPTERGFWELWRTPEGNVERVLSTGGPDRARRIAELTEAGAKKVGEAPISRLQWQRWARRPETAPKIFGAEFGGPSIRGGIFRESLPEAAGQRIGMHETRMAQAQIQKLTAPFGVDIPAGRLAKDPRFAHMAVPKPPSSGNPMAALKGMGLYEKAYPAEITRMIDETTAVWNKPQAIEAALGASDRVLGVWKSVTLYHPAYVMRNVFEKVFGLTMEGGNAARATNMAFFDRRIATLHAALAANNPAQVRTLVASLGGRDYPGDFLFNFARNWHGMGGGRTAMEIPARLGGPAGAGAVAGARRGWQRIHSAIFRSNKWFEDRQKLGAWFSFMEQGLDPQAAFMRTLRAMPDMADLPHWSRANLGRLFPWFRWRAKNASRMLGYYLPQKPAFMASLPRFKNVLEGITGQERVPLELRPDWMEESMYAQVMGGKQAGMAFGLETWFPFQEPVTAIGAPLAPGQAARRFVGELHPAARALAEAATGQSVFRQTPLQTIQEAGGLQKALPRAFMGQSGTALDPMLGLRPLREWAPGGRVSQMPTVGRGVARALVGGAIQPVDYQRGLMAKFYELNALQRKLRAQFNRALQARDQALADQLLRQWVSVVRQLYQYQFPLARGTEEMMQRAGVARPGPP